MKEQQEMFMHIFDEIEQATASRVNKEPEDYYVDGLLYCGKCRTAKQCRVTVFGQERTPYALCKCATEERDRKEAEQKRIEKMIRVDKLRKLGFADREAEKMKEWTFAKDDCSNAKISAVCRKYVENFDEMMKHGKGLLFYGTVGTGKTFYSACIANALIDKMRPCMITNFATVVNQLQSNFNAKAEYLSSLNEFDLLVLDDLGAERDTEYMNEVIQSIVDSRYRAGLPTIITTNLSAEELKNPADIKKQRTFSRLLEMCIPIEVTGKDRRREKLKSDYKDFGELLGL